MTAWTFTEDQLEAALKAWPEADTEALFAIHTFLNSPEAAKLRMPPVYDPNVKPWPFKEGSTK